MLKNKLFQKVTTLFCAVLMAATFAAPISAQTPPETVVKIDTAKVDAVTVIDRDLYVSYNVTSKTDRAAVVNALNAMPVDKGSVTEETAGLRLLQIRMLDGTKYQYWCHSNTLMSEEDTQLVTNKASLKPLYDLLDRCVKAYPANAEWLGYMNAYRITDMKLTDYTGPSAQEKTFQSALSASQRNTILSISAKLNDLKVSHVQKLGKEIQPKVTGPLLYNIQMNFETDKEGYEIKLYQDAMVLVVSSISYKLVYQINTTDNKAYPILTAALDAA